MARKLPDAQTWVDDMVQGATNNSNRWLRNAKAAVQEMVVNAQHPDAQASWEAGVQAAIADRAWGTSMSHLNASEVSQALDAAGAGAYSQGVTRKKAKIQRAIQQYIPHAQAALDKVNAMPRASLADRVNRMVANVEANIEAGRAYRGLSAPR